MIRQHQFLAEFSRISERKFCIQQIRHTYSQLISHLRRGTFTFHFYALEKEMATHSSVLAWRIPGIGEPGGLPSMGSHRVGHNWSDLAAAAADKGRVSQEALVVKTCLPMQADVRDAGSIPGLGWSLGGRHGNPLQYSCLETPTDRGAWRATFHRVTKSQTQLKRLNTDKGIPQKLRKVVWVSLYATVKSFS